MNTLVIAATNSKNSINLDLARKISYRGGYDLLELREYIVPMLNSDLITNKNIPDDVQILYEKISQYQKIIIVTHEHNGYYSAFFKNILDWLSVIEKKHFEGKKIILVVASPGSKGGESLRKIARTTLSFTGAASVLDFGFNNYDTNANFSKEIDNLVKTNDRQ